MDSQTPAALTLGPGGNDTFYDESTSECDPREDRAGRGFRDPRSRRGHSAVAPPALNNLAPLALNETVP